MVAGAGGGTETAARGMVPGLLAWPRRGASAFIAGIAPHWRIVRLLPSVSAGLTLGVLAGVVAGALLPVALTVTTGVLVGAVPGAVVGGIDSPPGQTVVRALLLVGALFIANRVVGSVRTAMGAQLGRRLDERLRERVIVALHRPIGIAHLEDPDLHDQIERAQAVAGGGYTAGGTVNPLANTAVNWLQSIGSALLLARFSVPLAVGWLCACVVGSHFLRREYLRSTKVATNQAKYVRRANYLRELALTPGAGKEMRVWGMLGWLTGRFTEEWQRVMQPVWQERTVGDCVHAAATIGLQASGFVVLAAIGLAAARGEMTLAALATYVGATGGVMAINAWGTDSFALAYGTATVPAVLELERRTAEAEARETLGGALAPDGMPREGIRLEGVAFRYPGRADDALKGLDLFIPAGRSLAIVGANGAGKTTLAKLVARLYDPTEGRITVDGVDLRTVDARRWQRRVSAIFQDFVQYHLTARDNVVFGAIERADDEAALLAAAQKSGALDVVEELPNGWETMLSRQYKGGADLSGGQWQRLALARALFAVGNPNGHPPGSGAGALPGASVLILDEPTANLDVRAEAALYDRFLDITHGLTTILISHRFSTVRRADRIVVLQGGRVLEQGTHDDLMALGGRYAEMFMLQASRFAGDGAEDTALERADV